ncbi:hypothetical protein MAFF241648_14560 [Ralstonia solanacearum]|nr:hypothetical protein MAFF241648_14560 [Ralstonia solanacearum]
MTQQQPYAEVFVAVYADGSVATNYSTGTRVYTKKHNAIARCPRGGRVLRFELKTGEVVHTRDNE